VATEIVSAFFLSVMAISRAARSLGTLKPNGFNDSREEDEEGEEVEEDDADDDDGVTANVADEDEVVCGNDGRLVVE